MAGQMRSLRTTILTLLVACLAGGAARAEDAADLRLVPFPKEVAIEPGVFDLKRPLIFTFPPDPGGLLHEILVAECRRAGLPGPRRGEHDTSGHSFRLFPAGNASPIIPPALHKPKPEEYVLSVRPDVITADAIEPAGLFHAVSTLCQLVRANRRETALPCMTIRDWPSVRWRAWQDDLTRGPSSTLDELKREVRLGAGLKMNLFTYYMEHQFAFRKHPLLGPADGSLEPEELKALVEYARPHHVDVLGNQQSFGHFGHILKHEAYQPLRETPDVLSPVNEGTYRLLDDLYSEVIPLLPFPFFNVCCDETWGLGTGPSKALAGQIGVGGVYARHIRRVHDLVAGQYKKRMMMWGDIILTHPKELDRIPRDTLMLTWSYDAKPTFEDQIAPFAKSGFEFFVCPGITNWNRILPEFGTAMANIQVFVDEGVRHGAIGVLNTAWDDDGETLNAPNWHGLAWGAECAWNASQRTRPEQFNRRIGAVLFGEKGSHFGEAIERLAQTHPMPGMNRMFNTRFWQLDLGSGAPLSPERCAIARRLLDRARPAIEHLEACRKEATANPTLLDALIFNARRIELIGERILRHYDAAQAYHEARNTQGLQAEQALARAESALRDLRDRHGKLKGEFILLWNRENRPYALDWTLKRYDGAMAAYDAALAALAAARKELQAGRPLPPIEKAGLNPLDAGTPRAAE